MYATLQAAFGTWPSDRSFVTEQTNESVHPSGVNETFNFDSEQPPNAARPVFTLSPNDYPSGKVFVPPFFVPPGVSHNGTHPHVLANSVVARSQEGSSKHPSRSTGRSDALSTSHRDSLNGQNHNEQGLSVMASEAAAARPGPLEEPQANPLEAHDTGTRSASPPPSAELEAERVELWSTESRKVFHEMVTTPGYINRYRLHMKKRERMMQYLQNPDKEPLLCDGSRDHQTKYQAAHWTVLDGKLYRKPESGRVARYRRHLDDFEAWDVLTMEHLRSGHLGRDKLRKVLEQNYIGYTLQEIMFVLKECKKCAGRGLNAEREDSNEDFPMPDATEDEDAADAGGVLTRSNPSAPAPVPAKGPYGRQQTSNFMWF